MATLRVYDCPNRLDEIIDSTSERFLSQAGSSRNSQSIELTVKRGLDSNVGALGSIVTEIAPRGWESEDEEDEDKKDEESSNVESAVEVYPLFLSSAFFLLQKSIKLGLPSRRLRNLKISIANHTRHMAVPGRRLLQMKTKVVIPTV